MIKLNIIDFTNQSNITEDSIENNFMHQMPIDFSNQSNITNRLIGKNSRKPIIFTNESIN